MTDIDHEKTRERRRQFQEQAAENGITDAYISVLVESFYARIRAHPELGPIFNTIIGDRWPEHLAKLKDFWASVALNAARYSGKPVPAHQKLSGVTTDHFQTWLALFRATLEDTAPSPEVVAHFMTRAERIAESLQLAMFGLPGLPAADGKPIRAKTIDIGGGKN